MSARIASLAALALVASPSLASAHIGLVSPESRYGQNVLKAGPCGKAGGTRTTDKVYEVKSGAAINIVWDEYINHPAHYRISFDDDGDDDFKEPSYNGPTDSIQGSGFTADEYPETLADLLPDRAGGTYNQTVTLPDIECDNCTLQLIQVMYDKPPYDCDTDPTGCNDVYHQCVDFILSADGPDQPTLVGGGDNPDGGMTGGGGGSGGGCSAAGGAGGGLWLAALALGLLWRRRRA